MGNAIKVLLFSMSAMAMFITCIYIHLKFKCSSILILKVQAEVRLEKAEKPSHGIIEIADKEKARFIVTGSRGMGVIRRTILGSVSDFILHHAHCPVFVYKMQ